MSYQQFILARVVFEDHGHTSPCWIWQGSKSAGYGTIRPRDGHSRAHRLAYASFVGPIPEGLELDHLCRVKACCNPDHLEPVTSAENIRRAAAHRTWNPPWKLVCKRGHKLTPDNRTKNGRNCRECERQRALRRRDERKARAA